MQRRKILLLLFSAIVFIVLISRNSKVKEDRMIIFQPEGLTWEKILLIVKTESKTGLIFFKSTGCIICKAMEERFFQDKKTIKYIESNFVAFKIDTNEKDGFILSKRFNVDRYPTLVFINELGDMLNKLEGYDGIIDEYLKRLKQSAEESLVKTRADYVANPENLKSALKYADLLYKADENKEALKIYEKIIDKITDDAIVTKVYTSMANCYRMTYDTKNAIKILEQGLAKGIFNDEIDLIHCWLGNLLCEVHRPIEQRDYTKALKYYQMIPKRAEDFKTYSRSDDDKRIIILQFNTAQDYIPFAYLKSAEQGQVGQEMTKESYIKTGKDILEKLFTDAYEKKDYREINSLANKCLQHETYLQEARGWLRKIIELPDNEKYLYTYGMVLQMCGEFEKAIEIQKRQLEYTKSEVDKEDGLMELAVLYFQAGKNEKGKAIFQNLYYNAQNNIDKLVLLSEICNRNNVNIRQALTWMKRAVELTKDNNYLEESRWMYISPEYLYNLYAELLFKTGQIQEAVESATKAVEIAKMEDRRRQYQENLGKYRSALK